MSKVPLFSTATSEEIKRLKKREHELLSQNKLLRKRVYELEILNNELENQLNKLNKEIK